MTTHDTNDPFAKRILERIEEERLSPRPRWEFIVKNWLFWMLGGTAVALGALAFSAALFEVENADWNYAAATHSDLFSFGLAVAPYLWVAALILFISLGYLNVRSTKRGYRYPLALIAAGAVITSVALGSALYATGFGGEVEEALGDHPPFYRPILIEQRSWWTAPEKGLIAGEVLKVATGTDHFILKDFSGNEWQVDTDEVSMPGAAAVSPGAVVRIVATLPAATSSPLHACFIFPWDAEGKGRAVIKKAAPGFEKKYASSSETTAPGTRSDECKGIRPYAQLRQLEGGE